MKKLVSYSQQIRDILLKIKPLSQTRNGFIEFNKKCEFIPFFNLGLIILCI